MDLFPHASFVRLRSRGRRSKYVHADVDAVGVSLRRLGAARSLHAVWAAYHLPGDDGGAFLLLQSCAYGRYLTVSDQAPPPGHGGVRAVQRDIDWPDLDHPFLWRAYRLEPDQEDYVRLLSHGRGLRANGRYRHGNNVVTADTRNSRETKMMQWRVEAVPQTPVPIPLPPSPPVTVSILHALRFWRHGAEPHPQFQVHPYTARRIRYVRADDEGNFIDDYDHWPEFDFYGNSVWNLRTEIARRLAEDAAANINQAGDAGNINQDGDDGNINQAGDDGNINQVQDDGNINQEEGITLCVRAGLFAAPIPLVTNLPDNEDPMDIIVLTTGSAATEQLLYPNI